MHGMTTNSLVNPDHKVKVSLTSQPIGTFTWDGSTEATFKTTIDIKNTHIYIIFTIKGRKSNYE